MKNFKMKVLRMILIVATFVMSKVSNKANQYLWLCHYLVGTGTDIEVPGEIVEEAATAFVAAIERYHCNYGSNGKPSITGTYYVASSLDYDGRGFQNRPKLFYMMGRFKFNLSGNKNHWVITAHDAYDWHHEEDKEGNPKYFSSPFSTSPVAKKFFALLGKVFGDDLFVTECWPTATDHCGISNKLWEVMSQYGAKSFTTSITSFVPTKSGKLNKELNRLNEEKQGFFAYKFLRAEGIPTYSWGKEILLILKEGGVKNAKATKFLRNISSRKEQLNKAAQTNNKAAFYKILARCL